MSAEQSILERIGAGDERAVNEFIDRYGDLVWSLARRFIRDQAEAEDAVQEIFLEIWSSATRYDRDSGSETTFVAMIARRRLIDRLRKFERQPRMETFEEESMGTSPGIGAPLESAVDVVKVARAVAELDAEPRRVLELSLYQGFSHSDISKLTKIPLGTVKTYLRRSLMRLRERFGDGGGA